MPAFAGKLRSNEIFAALYNMIISQQVFADNIAGTNGSLVDRARVDGSLYGDTKIYYSTDVLKSEPWTNDNEAANLLNIHRPKAPKQQAIVLDVFRQISLTVDNYLSKRAWKDEGAFSSFNSVMLSWIRETKRVYDSTTYNAYIGTSKSNIGTENIELDITTIVGTSTGEEKNRLEAQAIAQCEADLLVELKDVSREFNDYNHLRSYNISDLVFVWNSKHVNKITKVDVPNMFHKDIFETMGQDILPSKYFGKVNENDTKGDEKTVRSLIEQVIGDNHYFAGELIKKTDTAPAKTSYIVDDSIMFRIMHKRSVPFMSAFEVGTSFFNPKSLTENNYLTWGHNTLEYLMHYPYITVTKK